jgi:putative ABC transport system permease protein
MFSWLEDGRRDVGYALRTLARARAFTAVAIVTLALGIGAVVVIYSLLRNVLLDPFPYPHSDRMVDVVVKDASDRIIRGPSFRAPEFLDYQEQTQAFEDVVGTAVESMHWVTDTGAERLMVAWMTPNGFAFLGVPPLLGRVFDVADAAADAPPVAVLNHRTWMARFGGEPGVVGRSIVLNGQARTIIGVMPPRFEWNVADFWVPAALRRTDDLRLERSSRAFQARLRPGITIQEAEAQLNVIAARRAAEHPEEHPPHSRVQVITVIDWVVGQFRGVLYTLFAAVSLLLVIACCNVANMQLARATAREREITIRGALGASRSRIVRQLLAESAILASGGVIAGTLLAYAGIGILARLMPRQGIPWETELRLDTPVLVFALATAALATFAFGLFPALQGARRELVAAANSSGRSGTADRRQTRMRSGLVIAEVALSIVLLLGAGLLMRSFLHLVSIDLGFNPGNLLLTRLAFPPGEPDAEPDRTRLYRDAIDRLHTVPGVRSVTASNSLIGGMETALEVPGAARQPASAQIQFCSEEFVETLGLRLGAGRPMSALEVKAGHKVAVVNQMLAARYFSGLDPVGRTVRLPRLSAPPVSMADPTFTIVGVVSDVLNQGPRQAPAPQLYVPYTVRKGASLSILVRTFTDPLGVLPAIRMEIQALDPQVALIQPLTVDNLLDRGLYAQPRFSLLVLSMFAYTGLLLVALGIYGVLAYTVSLQRRELAIRMALGAERRHVLRHVFGMGLKLIGGGIIVGLGAGIATNRLLVNQLWNTSPNDPLTIAAVVLVVCMIGTLACWVPARRAIQVQPSGALRDE